MPFFDDAPSKSALVKPDGFLSKVWRDWWSTHGSPGTPIYATRANRVNYPAASYPNVLYVESDTRAIYVSDGTAWKAIAGIWRNALANRPSSGGATAWSGATAYVVGDLASRLGVDYYCVVAHTNHQPPNSAYWYVLPALGANDTGLRFDASDTPQRFYWNGSAWIEDYELTDSATATVTTLLKLVHKSSGLVAGGFGSRTLSQLEDAGGGAEDAAALVVTWSNAAHAALESRWAVWTRIAAGALAESFAVTSGFILAIGTIYFKAGTAFLGQLTHANTGNRVYTFPNETTNVAHAPAALTADNFVYGDGNAKVKDAGFSRATIISDTAYASGWNGVADVAPSKNAVYDEFVVVLAQISALLGSTAYGPTNVTPDRAYDADATTVPELADVLGTLIADLQAKGILT